MKLPAELFDYRQWVLWRIAEVDGRKTKLPISPWSGKLASCDKPHTWSSYKHVRYALRRFRCDGIGFVSQTPIPFVESIWTSAGPSTASLRLRLSASFSNSKVIPNSRLPALASMF